MTTKAAYQKILSELYRGTDNPTYELCQPTIENLVGEEKAFDLVAEGYIQYVGRNCNGVRVYQVR